MPAADKPYRHIDRIAELEEAASAMLAALKMVRFADGKGAAIPIGVVHRAIARAEAAGIKSREG